MMTRTLNQQAMELSGLLEDLVDCAGTEDEECVCCYDVSFSEYRALRVLQDEKSPPMQTLAERLDVTKGGATRIVDRLERKGYARRGRDAEDGRVCCVMLTPDAEALLGRIARDRRTRGHAIVQELDPGLREHVLDSLRVLRRATRNAAASERPDRRPATVLSGQAEACC